MIVQRCAHTHPAMDGSMCAHFCWLAAWLAYFFFLLLLHNAHTKYSIPTDWANLSKYDKQRSFVSAHQKYYRHFDVRVCIFFPLSCQTVRYVQMLESRKETHSVFL